MRTILLLLLLLTVIPTRVYTLSVVPDSSSDSEKKKTPHIVPRVDTKIRIDGVLDEEAWQKALELELKYEVFPGDNIKPRARTEVFFAYSKTHFYAAFYAYDPNPSAIRANLSARDKLWSDDWMGITVDTFNDRRRRFTFFINPFGVQADTVETETDEDVGWDTIWASAGRIVDDGYIIEIAIPFSSMRFQRKKPGEEQVWGVDVFRNYPRNLRHFMGLFARDRNNNCYICQFDKIIGFKGAKPGKNIEIDPSLSGILTQQREGFYEGKFKEKDSKLHPGITAHWSFTPNMTLSAAVNPDFSHVEADAAQLDVNLQFALNYPEKRPLFLEGQSFFQTRLPVFYSRTLADPDWGIKLTGKEKGNAIGFYSVRDNITNLIFPGSYLSRSTSLDMKTMGTILRYRRDLGEISTLGVVLTDREGDDYYNRMAGADLYYRFTKHKELRFQFLASQTRYPGQVAANFSQPGDKFTGTALDFNFKHRSRNFGYHLSYQQITPGFRGDLGFFTQVGYRHVTAGFNSTSYRNPGHWYSEIMVAPWVTYEYDFDDNLIYKSVNAVTYYKGPLQMELTMTGSLGKRSFMGKIFNNNYGRINLLMKPTRPLILWFNVNFGHQIDFTNAQAGTRIMLNPGISYKAGRRLALTLDHSFERLKVDAGRLYTANVSYLRLNYHFSRRAFLRTIFQYVNYDYNVENYIAPRDPEYKHFFTQVLFSYRINPQTMLFLGYSDDYYGYSYLPMTQTNRTVFLKIGYALVL